ncbi:phosphoenolpyruvate--protein phosphotransferase [Acidipropionibacterium jensenii]|uniref:phosphoenolpyruvate--protein phosphotransferase n=1 Tax=Acidipropionibacterium jensenii TaxID=1749 RepID=UPI00264A0C69|nr:phosphoenolpyruvate--protein phosphotransferase [Acidipropionibacterium jensenii]MDN5978264.1 phosphoenolpyruvate--protein phosphotransferase [Acidipropionibacterium jensenii]MDN5996190.1 phosphoenolpyruvate--protein phosphotransferase [Acidipropionibacterium jensenii]MDN6427867.1 phosphoenolpyruvate--protein phosphotransferase [Acidipropionibacterium jensenii]MDN6442692.1 phosphoenolpyruvate--protein phosphotransferase [Acidipropionibacterium jensenii]MDN6481356.1 phosphoenolpyruvate--prot
MQTLTGLGVSAGVGQAQALVVSPAPGLPEVDPKGEVKDDLKKITVALNKVADRLDYRAMHADSSGLAVLTATAMMARDPGLVAKVEAHLHTGAGPARALWDAFDEFCDQLAAAGGYLAERVTDLKDVRSRALAVLEGLPEPGVPTLDRPAILVAEDLAPADTATLNPELVKGLITAAGGPTSHTAILAAQIGIPAIVRCPEARSIVTGTNLALDGVTGTVLIDPEDAAVIKLTERADKRKQVLESAPEGESCTSDGLRVLTLANIGSPADAVTAKKKGAEGVGLFRTEFLFLERQDAPSKAEQADVYAQVLSTFDEDAKVVFRTLDAGADKPLAFADLGPEDNPALGRRGLRLSQVRTDLMDTQLAALAEAARKTDRMPYVMAPMVATPAEAKWFSSRARKAGLSTVGVMVEVPAAALRSSQVLETVEFASIGTNDLTQYAMAADRLQGELSELLTPWQPAVIQLVKATCDGAGDRLIGVCGEAAGDPLLALVLVGVGIRSLSMAAGKIQAVKAALAMHTTAQCEVMAQAALAAPSPELAKAAALKLADPGMEVLVS